MNFERQPQMRLERSEYFRHAKDFAVLADETEKRLESAEKIKFLEIGIGNMEEPISFLATIKKETQKKGKTLQESVDWEFVELRPESEVETNFSLGTKPDSSLGEAFLTEEQKKELPRVPRKPKRGLEDFFHKSEVTGEYEFDNEVQDFVRSKMSEENKAHFGTKVEDFLTQDAEKQYDFVACNNVLQHLGSGGEYPSPIKWLGTDKETLEKVHDKPYAEIFKNFLDTVEGVSKLVKKDGILFIHVPAHALTGGEAMPILAKEMPFFKENFEQVAPGVYKRKS